MSKRAQANVVTAFAAVVAYFVVFLPLDLGGALRGTGGAVVGWLPVAAALVVAVLVRRGMDPRR